MAKVLLTKNEIDILISDLGSWLTKLADDGLEKSKRSKELIKIHDKLVKGLNKTGVYYLWQLKDREKGVNDDNIKDEWK